MMILYKHKENDKEMLQVIKEEEPNTIQAFTRSGGGQAPIITFPTA